MQISFKDASKPMWQSLLICLLYFYIPTKRGLRHKSVFCLLQICAFLVHLVLFNEMDSCGEALCRYNVFVFGITHGEMCNLQRKRSPTAGGAMNYLQHWIMIAHVLLYFVLGLSPFPHFVQINCQTSACQKKKKKLPFYLKD